MQLFFDSPAMSITFVLCLFVDYCCVVEGSLTISGHEFRHEVDEDLGLLHRDGVVQ